MSTKRKPFSRVQNAKKLRSLVFSMRRDEKKLVKSHAPDWYARLVGESYEATERLIKLEDFLWVADAPDAPRALSDEAKALPPKHLMLLARQSKAMQAYAAVLAKRVKLGWTPEKSGAKR